MDISPLTQLLGVAILIFAALLTLDERKRRKQPSRDTGRMTEIAAATLASINIAGMLGFGWLAASILFYDGLMILELALCVAPIIVLAAATYRASVLERHGKDKASLAFLAAAALPTLFIYGFLVYLGNNPIDMR